MPASPAAPSVATPSPAELLLAVDGWLWTLANRAAKRNRSLDAADLHQEAAVRILRFGHRYDATKSKPSTWAFQVMRSVILSTLKDLPKHRRARPVDPAVLSAKPDRADPDDTADADDLAQLAAALDRLPPRYRAVLELRHGINSDDGPMEQTAIGRRFGVSRQRVWQLEREAERKLRLLLSSMTGTAA